MIMMVEINYLSNVDAGHALLGLLDLGRGGLGVSLLAWSWRGRVRLLPLRGLSTLICLW